jgi:hypothetical protein
MLLPMELFKKTPNWLGRILIIVLVLLVVLAYGFALFAPA